MTEPIETERLTLQRLSLADSPFILELVNTPDWIRFIGERNIKDIDGANEYILEMNNHPNIDIWTVQLRETETAIGIVTFIKKEYLEFRDFGFAFLPEYYNKGYAFESSSKILDEISNQGIYQTILAVTVKGNERSTHLLKKLGFKEQEERIHENQSILIYSKNSSV